MDVDLLKPGIAKCLDHHPPKLVLDSKTPITRPSSLRPSDAVETSAQEDIAQLREFSVVGTFPSNLSGIRIDEDRV
jgi:hypothetical protein